MRSTAICASVVVILAISAVIQAATLHVPADYASIQTAIDVAISGVDEIEVASGTYNERINFNGKAVRLYSSEGSAVTTINGGGGECTVVRCTSGEDSSTILEGFTITGGNSSSSLYIGGGMYNKGSSPTVTNCTFSDNSVGFWGGGMANLYESSPTVTNCTFSGNTARVGGGMYNSNSSPTVINCAFSCNTAHVGGGIWNSNSGPTVTDCTFSSNTAGHTGGGICNTSSSSPTVANCMFSSNIADVGGGGISNSWYSSPTVTNCMFSGNSVLWGGSGGGMDNSQGSSPTVTNCTFSGNSAGLGGGMYNQSSNPTMANCILWGDVPNEIHGNATVTYSNVQGGWLGDGNINLAPLFSDADGRLSADSPCIDAGDSASVPADVTVDLDGNPRIQGAGVDMGAYETPVANPVQLIADLIQDVVSLNIHEGIANSLDSKLEAALKAIDDLKENNDVAALNSIQAFIKAVEAQRGKEIPEADANALIAAAQEIIDLLTNE